MNHFERAAKCGVISGIACCGSGRLVRREAHPLFTTLMVGTLLAAFLVASPARAGVRDLLHVQKPRGKSGKIWSALTVLSLGSAVADVHFTIQCKATGCYENNPLARPFVSLPNPAYATLAMAGTGAIDFSALKMRQSSNPFLRRFWWVPQVAQIAGNVYGAQHTARLL